MEVLMQGEKLDTSRSYFTGRQEIIPKGKHHTYAFILGQVQ